MNLSAQLEAQKERAQDVRTILIRLAEDVFLPLLARRYDASGLHSRSGLMRRAISQRGARGNIFEIHGNTVTLGIDYAVVPYAQPLLEGAAAYSIVPRSKRALRFMIGDRTIFSKRVRHPGFKPRDIYQIDAASLEEAAKIVQETLGSDWMVKVR